MKLSTLKTMQFTWYWLVPAVLLAAIVGFAVGNWSLLQQIQQLESKVVIIQEQQSQTAQELAKTAKQADFLTANLAVEKSTNKILQQDLSKSGVELAALKKQMAVYQKIVTPEPDTGTLVLKGMRIKAGKAKGTLRFSVFLIEQNKQKTQTQAQLSLKLYGKQRGKKISVDLVRLASLQQRAKRILVKDMRTIEGDFKLPKNFTPERIDINISSNSGQGQSTVTIKRSYPWQGNLAILE